MSRDKDGLSFYVSCKGCNNVFEQPGEGVRYCVGCAAELASDDDAPLLVTQQVLDELMEKRKRNKGDKGK